MSEWAGPPQSSDTPRRPTDGVDALLTKVAELKRGLRDLPSGLLKAAGISISAEGMTIDSSLTVHGDLSSTGQASFDGTLDVAAETKIGGDLAVSGDAEFSGDLDVNGSAVVAGEMASADFDGNLSTGDAGTTGWAMNASRVAIGELFLRPGSVGNDELANPVAVSVAAPSTQDGWTVSTSHSNKATTSIPVPSGFTRASVVAWASMHFQDSAPNGGWVRAVIDGQAGDEMGGLANLNLGQTALHARNLTGLSGGSITLAAQVRASVASSATTGRIAQISGIAVFSR